MSTELQKLHNLTHRLEEENLEIRKNLEKQERLQNCPNEDLKVGGKR